MAKPAPSIPIPGAPKQPSTSAIGFPPAHLSATGCASLTAGLTAPSTTDSSRRLTAASGEADEFYAAVQRPELNDEERLIQRQALAGMLWSKQLLLL